MQGSGRPAAEGDGDQKQRSSGSPLSKRAGACGMAHPRQMAPGPSRLAERSFCFLTHYHITADGASSERKAECVERLQKKEDTVAQISSAATGGSTGANPDLLPSRAMLKRTIAGLALLSGIAAATTYGYQYWTVGRFLESTDDAYVKADYTTIAPKVSGYIADVLVEDNEPVKRQDSSSPASTIGISEPPSIRQRPMSRPPKPRFSTSTPRSCCRIRSSISRRPISPPPRRR
jgi:hypothetical protein